MASSQSARAQGGRAAALHAPAGSRLLHRLRRHQTLDRHPPELPVCCGRQTSTVMPYRQHVLRSGCRALLLAYLLCNWEGFGSLETKPPPVSEPSSSACALASDGESSSSSSGAMVRVGRILPPAGLMYNVMGFWLALALQVLTFGLLFFEICREPVAKRDLLQKCPCHQRHGTRSRKLRAISIYSTC